MKTLTVLEQAYAGSYYTILGAGGDIQDWVDGYTAELEKQKIGAPREWFVATGEAINHFASSGGAHELAPNNEFQPDLTALLFPLEGLDVGKLAMFKLQMQDRWFDDIVDNMRM